VTRLTIRVSLIHREANVVVLKFAVPLERDAASGALRILAIDAGGQKRVPALGAKEMLFVVCALPEFWVIQSDETLVHNRRLAMIAPWCEALMIIEMAERFSVALIRADVLQQIITVRTSETPRVPADTHCTDNAPNNGATTSPARKAAPTPSG